MKVSTKGTKFISLHEGNPLTAYLDPVGIPTIGHGFTMRSKTVREELAKLGIRKLVPGKTRLTAAQSDAIFEKVLNGPEFAGAVQRGVPAGKTIKQHMFDAMASAVFNLGPGFMGWRWKDLWISSGVAAAAAYWSRNYNKAAGRRLPGLVRRRKEEAKLIEHGIYTGVKEGEPRGELPEPPKAPDPVTKEAQDALKELGIDPGESDGWFGAKTREAILTYQKQHPHLKNDGILGPATLAQLRRDISALKDAAKSTLPTAVGVGGASGIMGLPWGWIVAGVLLAGGIYFAWRYRDVIQRRWNKLTGRTVEV